MDVRLKHHLWISFAIIVLSVAITAFAVFFLSNAIESSSEAIVKARSLIDQQTGAIGVLANLEKQAPQAAVYQAAMDSLLPTQDGLIGFSSWIENVASANQVSAQVNFQGGQENDSALLTTDIPGTTSFSIVLDGTLPNITAFLVDAETKQPGFMISFNSFNLVMQGQAYQLTGQGTVYFRQS